MNELTVRKTFDQDELQGVTLILPLLKVPSGGGTFFTKKIGDEKKPVEIVKGVIIDHFPTRTRFKPKDGDKITKEPPLCTSRGGITGSGDPGGECDKCQYAKFVKGVKTQCQMRREIYIMEEGEVIPTLLNMPSGSLKAFNMFMSWLIVQGYGSTKEVHVKISLMEQTALGGEPYSTVLIQFDRDCSKEETNQYYDFAMKYKSSIRKTDIPDFSDEEFVDETLEQKQSLVLTKAYIVLEEIGLDKKNHAEQRKAFCNIVMEEVQPHDWKDEQAKNFLDYLSNIGYNETKPETIEKVKKLIVQIIEDNK